MFARQWLRAVLGAGGVVLVVPLGLVLAAVLAAASGGSSLDGLGQVIDGPQVPRAQAVAADTDRDPARARELDLPDGPVRGRAGTTRRSAAAPATRPGGGGGASGGTSRPQTSTPTTPRRPTARPTPGRTPRPARPTPNRGPAAPPAAAQPNVAPGLGKAVDDTVRPLAPPVADAAGSVIDLLAPPG